jgi:hypothetical protein
LRLVFMLSVAIRLPGFVAYRIVSSTLPEQDHLMVLNPSSIEMSRHFSGSIIKLVG